METRRERLDAEYRALIGKRIGKLTVLEFVGRAPNKTHLMMRVRCDCGNEFLTEASRLAHGRRKGRSCAACSFHGETICWDCANSADEHKCPWAGLKPRTDWEAAPTKIASPDGTIDSFIVLKCPGFTAGRRGK